MREKIWTSLYDTICKNIIGDVRGFNNFDFTEFGKIFSIIEKIIKKRDTSTYP
jgi:hypothetical protein